MLKFAKIQMANREVGIARLNLQFCQYPDAIRQFDRLIEHVLTLDITLGYREHVIVAQFL